MMKEDVVLLGLNWKFSKMKEDVES
jgi:hypothetical protein